MGTSPTLMVVLTHPQDPAREAEFNEWYSGNHIQDVLLIPGFESANRFKQAKSNLGEAPQYLALYQVETQDAWEMQQVLMKHFTTPNDYRLPMPPPTGEAEGGIVGIDGWAYFEKVAEVGKATPAGSEAPKALMTVFTHAEDPREIGTFNDWYTNNHIVDVIKAPHFRSCTRYKMSKLNRGTMPAPYLAVYELDSDDIEAVHAGLMKWLQTPDDFRLPMPQTQDGKGLVTIDYWGYYRTFSTALKIPMAELMAGAKS